MLPIIVSVQLEAGVTFMERPEDDVYVQYRLPHAEDSVRFETPTFGAALRLDTQRWQVALGWRDLGNQHLDANIIGDEDYFACRAGKKQCISAYQARWFSTGDEQQVYLECGYKLQIGSWELVPSVGVADNRTSWHYNVYWRGAGAPVHWDITQPDQSDLAPFVGLSVEHGALGAGVFLLETAPPHTANNFDGQGERAVYARVTYSFAL